MIFSTQNQRGKSLSFVETWACLLSFDWSMIFSLESVMQSIDKATSLWRNFYLIWVWKNISSNEKFAVILRKLIIRMSQSIGWRLGKFFGDSQLVFFEIIMIRIVIKIRCRPATKFYRSQIKSTNESFQGESKSIIVARLIDTIGTRSISSRSNPTLTKAIIFFNRYSRRGS